MIHLTSVQLIEWLLAISLEQWLFDRVVLYRVYTDTIPWLAGYELVRLGLLPNSYVSINQMQWNAVLYTTAMIQATSVLFIRWLLAMFKQWLFDWAALWWRCALSLLSTLCWGAISQAQSVYKLIRLHQTNADIYLAEKNISFKLFAKLIYQKNYKCFFFFKSIYLQES